jgi:hypothetical protein
MSVGGIGGGNKQFINAGTEAIQQGGPEVLDTVATGLDQANKAGRLDEIQAFNELPAIQTGGFETAEAGSLQPPAEFFNEADKFGVVDSRVNTLLNDPQFDPNEPLTKFAENRFATKFDPSIAQVSDAVTAVDDGGTTQSSGNKLIDAFGQKEDQIQKDIDELLNLDTSTPEGKKRALELQTEIQTLQQMESVIMGLLNAQNQLLQKLADNIGR